MKRIKLLVSLLLCFVLILLPLSVTAVNTAQYTYDYDADEIAYNHNVYEGVTAVGSLDNGNPQILNASAAAAAGVPAGYTGSVYQCTATANGQVGFQPDFSAARLQLDRIESIAFRIYVTPTASDTGTYPEMRITTSAASGWNLRYGLSTTLTGHWIDIVLSVDNTGAFSCPGAVSTGGTINDFDRDKDGYLDFFHLTFRTKGANVCYVDRYTVNLKQNTKTVYDIGEFKQQLPIDGISAFYSTWNMYSAATAGVNGVPAGSTGNVAACSAITVGMIPDFSSYNIKIALIESITLRVYVSGNKLHDVAGGSPEVRITTDAAATWTLRYALGTAYTDQWMDITLKPDSNGRITCDGALAVSGFLKDLDTDSDGYLDCFNLIVRGSGAEHTVYVDSISVKADANPTQFVYNGAATVYTQAGTKPDFHAQVRYENISNPIAYSFSDKSFPGTVVWSEGSFDQYDCLTAGTHTATLTAVNHDGETVDTLTLQFVAAESEQPPTDLYYEGRYGDANADGRVDIRDIVRIKKYFSTTANQLDFDASDFNDDGELDAMDMTALHRLLLGR